MKKLLLLVAIMLCCAMTMFAQNNKISYQAVVRNSENQLVANKSVDVTVEIFNGTETTAAYTETHTNVQTNYNGLFSLQIGGGTATGVSWDEAEINWKDAKVITAVSLDGTELATLNMPLTAVPYALYADYAEEINPDAVVVTEIYEKMFADSNALAGQITNLDSKLTSKIHEDSVALAGQINTVNSNLTDKIYADSLALGTLIDGNASEINDLKTADANFTTRMNNISDSVKTNFQNIAINKQAIIDSTDHVRNNLRDTASTLRGLIKTTDNKFADYYTKAESDELLGAKADTGRVYTRDIIDDKLATKANSTDIPTVPTNVSAFTNDAKYVSNAQCENLNICQLMTDVNNLLTTVGNLNNTIDGLNNTIAGMQQTINDLKDQNEDLAQRISEMEELEHVFDLSNISSDTTIKDGWKVTGTLSGDYKVTIADGASVTFDGVNIHGDGSSTGHAGITCEGNATIILAHGSTNSVNSAHENYPGIYVPAVPAGKTLTIEGSGSLYANGNGNAAGIGGGSGLACGNIRIVEGTVTATGGAGAAGIGGGSACGTITITDGVNIVTASKGVGALNSVGVGENGTCGKVTIGDVEYWDGSNHYENGGGDYLTQPTLVYHPIVTSVSLSSTFVEENVNGVFQLTVTPSPSDATVKWSVTNGSEKVKLYSDADCNTPLSTDAIPAGTIYVKALAEGTATIKVASSANPAKYAECIVDVFSNNEDLVTIASTFGYCYDCQRSPAYPTTGSSCTFSGFSNPHVGNYSTTGPWKLEYKGSYANDNPYNIYLDNYKSEYNVDSVPIFELWQWDATQNDFVHAAYGVVCAYSNVTGNVDHTAFFEAKGGWGCYLTGQSHSSSLHLTFDEYMSDGLHSLIPNKILFSYITVSKGNTSLSSDKRFYYAQGDTYRAAANRSENKLTNTKGWFVWDGGDIGTVYYKEGEGLQGDMSIDGRQRFGSEYPFNLDSVINPEGHTYTFAVPF